MNINQSEGRFYAGLPGVEFRFVFHNWFATESEKIMAMYRIDTSQFPEVVTKVRLVSTPDCTSCPSVRSFLDRNGIPYEEAYLVDATEEERAQIDEHNIMTAPVLFVNDLLVAAGGVQYPVLKLIESRHESKQAAEVAA